MKTIKLIGIAVALLAANNFLLFYFLDDFSGAKNNDITQAATEPVAIRSTKEQTVSKPDEAQVKTEGQISQFVASLEQAIKRDDFKQVWDQYQIERNDHYTESQQYLSALEPFELFDIIQYSTDRIERQVAQQILMSKGMQDLENYQLKELYKNPVFSKWGKSEILSTLLQNNDPEGLGLAKVALTEHNKNLFNSSFDTDLMQSIYEQDPDFMVQYAANYNIDKMVRFSPVTAFFAQEYKLAAVFLKNNFDKIIGSERRHVLQMGSNFSNVEISPSQQEDVIELFDSNNRYKRELGVALVANLKNTDSTTLTTLFNKLSRKQQKRTFIYKLYYNSNDPKLKAFAKQLASESNDPQLKQIAQ